MGVTMKNSAEMMSRLRIFQSRRRRTMPSRRTTPRMMVTHRKKVNVLRWKNTKETMVHGGQENDGQVQFAEFCEHRMDYIMNMVEDTRTRTKLGVSSEGVKVETEMLNAGIKEFKR